MFIEKASDYWETPQWLFDELNVEFNFALDLCATKDNAKAKFCGDYFTLDLRKANVNACFMNPPYSDPAPFISKAWEDSCYCKIVMVIPSKADTKWWRIFWDGVTHSPRAGVQVIFMPYKEHHNARVSFINPETRKPKQGNVCGTSVVIMDRRNL